MFRFSVLCALAFLVVTSCSKKPREGVAIVVNGYEIMRPEVMQTAEMLRESMIAAFPEKAVEGVTSKLLAGAAHQLIANRLLIEEAKKRGITADQTAINSGFLELQKRFPDETTFKRQLSEMGETDSSFKARLAEGICLDTLMARILSRNHQVDTQQCKTFYKENSDQYREPTRTRVGQIFLPFTENMSKSDQKQLAKKAEEIKQQIVGGKSFEKCAKQYSHGPGSDEGGDLGWFKKGDLRKDLETPLDTLAKGELSNVVTSDLGVHLLRKTDEEAERLLPFEEVEKRIRLLLELKERNTLVSRYIDSLSATATISYIDSSLVQKPTLGTMGLLSEPPQQ